mgnify:CR=1 FL=1
MLDARSGYGQEQSSPYITFTLPHGGGANVIRVGYDSEKAGLRGFDAGTLESNAIFIEDDWTVNDVLRVNAGSRYERSEQQKASGETRDYSLVAHQLGASWKAAENLTVFSKVARSFRIPNANENGFAGVGTTRVPFLNPQIADEVEVGLKTAMWTGEFSSTLFVMDVENELFFDPTIVDPALFINGLNSNLDELRRKGLELKWNGSLRKDLRMVAAYQYLDAEFRSGSLSGSRVPLVAAHNLKVAAEYDWTSRVSTEAIVNMQSDQRSAANTDLQIPGFGVLDLNWRYRQDSYSVVFQVQNVFDKQYYRTQFGPNGIYPEIGRAFFINLNADF